MTPSEFLALANKTLVSIEDAVGRIADSTDIDLEASRASNVLTLEFEDGSKIIVNSQEPMQEIWVAAKSGGFHYRWNGTAWVDTKDAGELFAGLSRYVSQQAGAAVVLAAS